jgi:hypothetical protein
MRASRASVARAEGGKANKQIDGDQNQLEETHMDEDTRPLTSLTKVEQAHHVKVNIRSRSQQQPSDLDVAETGCHVKCSQLVHLLQRSHAYAKAAVEAARKVYKHTQYASWCIQSTCCATRPVPCANWGPPLCSEESGQRQCNRRCMQRPGA